MLNTFDWTVFYWFLKMFNFSSKSLQAVIGEFLGH